ncbi:uncharacterized protein TNCV_4680041 [Trichonephila clavipes]|nr:uncharacterized protein TNCV_4680041 [Trichonephila clavipes]
MIQKKLHIGSAVLHKIIHEELSMIKVVCRCVPHYLTEHQREERVTITKEFLKLRNYGGHDIISKIVTGDEMYILFFDDTTRPLFDEKVTEK